MKSLPPVLLRNTSRLAFIDWQCPLCLSLNFSSNVRCFICDAPFDEHRCMALASSKLPAIPPLFVGDHSRYWIPYELHCVVNTEGNVHVSKSNDNNDNNNNSSSDSDSEEDDQVSYFDDEKTNNKEKDKNNSKVVDGSNDDDDNLAK